MGSRTKSKPSSRIIEKSDSSKGELLFDSMNFSRRLNPRQRGSDDAVMSDCCCMTAPSTFPSMLTAATDLTAVPINLRRLSFFASIVMLVIFRNTPKQATAYCQPDSLLGSYFIFRTRY